MPVPVFVLDHRRRQPHARGTLARRVDAVRRNVHHGAQQLGFAAAWVATQQDVDVSAQSTPILHIDFTATK